MSEAAVLLSMTGYGEARTSGDALSVAVEVRTLNNRYLKVMLRAAEPYNLLEPEVEKLVRRCIRRGTVQIHLRIDRETSPQDFRLDAGALRGYFTQLRSAAEGLGVKSSDAWLPHLLALPGVVGEPGGLADHLSQEWPIIEGAVEKALAKMQAMRQDEGRAMARELAQHRDTVGSELERIRERAPHVGAAYRDRLHERVRALLSEIDVEVEPSDLIKEVSIFAERSDIAEEVVRLASHLDQFREIVEEPESPGRKLEFLTQEMFREANTIGSKAGDVEISRGVVEIKGTLEKIRELVLNVE